ncbi:hypothetical protein FJ425_22245, partial [Mesorhizobium sp. B2-7-2]
SSLFTNHYSLFTIHYSLLTTHYSLLTTHYCPTPVPHTCTSPKDSSPSSARTRNAAASSAR